MRTTRHIPWRPPASPDPCPDSLVGQTSVREALQPAPPGDPLHPFYSSNPALWVSNFLPLQPDPPQSAILQSAHSNLILNCSRQWGKTTVIAAKALHFALFRPASTILVAAPSERQSVTLLRRLRSFLRALGIPPRSIPWVPLSVLLPNSSEIIALPASADTTRGFTAHLMIFDEASRVPDSIYNALSPARATTAAPLWLLSTPNGCSGFFYDAWHENNPDFGDPSSTFWTRFLVPATQCPRISPEFLKHERLMLGDETYRQEYLCEFITPGGRLFSAELLRAAIDPDVVPLFTEPLWSQP